MKQTGCIAFVVLALAGCAEPGSGRRPTWVEENFEHVFESMRHADVVIVMKSWDDFNVWSHQVPEAEWLDGISEEQLLDAVEAMARRKDMLVVSFSCGNRCGPEDFAEVERIALSFGFDHGLIFHGTCFTPFPIQRE